MLANVHRELGEFDLVTEGLKNVLEERPSEFGVLMSLLQNYVEHGFRCVETGLFGRATECAQDAINVAVLIVKDTPNAFNMWKALGDACAIFSWVQSGAVHYPSDEAQGLLHVGAEQKMYELLSDVDQVSLGALDTDNMEGNAPGSTLPEPLIVSMLAYKRAIHCASADIHAQAVAWYNLGWMEQRAFACSPVKQGKKYLKTAVRCFKRAIELEAGNAELWNALGVVTTTLNPKVAQHSFVRSLHLNELNAKVWTNLGVLYLLQNDIELAHQAFGRAQSTDPDYAHAWLGEGIIALMTGNSLEALNHFTHAFEISDSTSFISKRQYALSSFDHILSSPSDSTSNDQTKLIQPIFALAQLRTQLPHDLPYQHLAALFFERVGNFSAAISTLQDLCATAEQEYEVSESLEALARFGRAKSDLARNQLAASAFDAAAENAELALELSSEAEDSGLNPEQRTKLRLSAHLTAGLAAYYRKDLPKSVEMFKAALEESNSDPDVVCSLVQVLWAQGGADEKSVAREQLSAAVEKDPDHVGVIVLMGVMAVLDDDRETWEAVREDLLAMRTIKGDAAAADEIETLLTALAALSADDAVVMEAAQASILLNPHSSKAWANLAELTGEVVPAEMALRTAEQAVPPLGAMETSELARAFAGVGTVGDAQRAISLAPWEGCGWNAMAEVLA
jgi:superkiller protein 3